MPLRLTAGGIRCDIDSRVLVAATLVVMTATTSAHHSVSGQYDTSKPMTLTGVISKVDWINPHIYLHLDVKEKDGAVDELDALDTADGDDAPRRADAERHCRASPEKS